MGIFHFAPVGTSPGAVTSALAYLKQKKDKFSIRGPIIESIILFVSPDVRDGRTRIRECVFNDYMTLNDRKTWKNANIVDVVCEFIKTEISDVIPPTGTIYCIVVDPNDYDACFETAAKVAIYFSPPDDVGKNIWGNLTGGTNVLNAALLQVAFFSGLISRIYYTFVAREEDRKYLQPIKDDRNRFLWDDISVVKTAFDNIYFALLQMLKELGDGWYLDEELLGRLKQGSWEYLSQEDIEIINNMNLQTFRRQWLNKLDGRELERQILPDGSFGRAIRLSDSGKRLVERINSPFFQALIQRGKGIDVKDIESITHDIKIETLWVK